jgi:hypothetical protein
MRLRLGLDHIKFSYYISFVSWLSYYYPFIFVLLYLHFMYFIPVRSFIGKHIRIFVKRFFKRRRRNEED